jgi:calcium permeable stress-gated cation channel
MQEAMRKGILERAREPTFDLKAYLASAYVFEDDDKYSVVVPMKRHSRRATPAQSKQNA